MHKWSQNLAFLVWKTKMIQLNSFAFNRKRWCWIWNEFIMSNLVVCARRPHIFRRKKSTIYLNCLSHLLHTHYQKNKNWAPRTDVPLAIRTTAKAFCSWIWCEMNEHIFISVDRRFRWMLEWKNNRTHKWSSLLERRMLYNLVCLPFYFLVHLGIPCRIYLRSYGKFTTSQSLHIGKIEWLW